MENIAGGLGAGFYSGLRYIGGMAWLFADALFFIFIAPFGKRKLRVRGEPVLEQMVRVGFTSLGIVCLVQLFIGVVIALQLANLLKTFGIKEYVGSVVGLGIFRELGPLMTAMVMAGYAGAAMSAELGTMAVSEEIEALRALAISPVRYLVVPRLIAAALMIPCVTMVGDFVGVLGGMGIAWTVLHISPDLFIQKMLETLVTSDVVVGIFKSWVFAILIALIACFEGLRVDSGAEGVGKAATRSVVYSIVMIISADCVFAAVFRILLGR